VIAGKDRDELMAGLAGGAGKAVFVFPGQGGGGARRLFAVGRDQ
jgi:hypothetical protein